MAGQIARPVLRLDRAARRVAEGDLSARATVEGAAEQQSLARTFNDMTARLEQLLSSQREFVADASHQLRTPLTGLRLRVGGRAQRDDRARGGGRPRRGPARARPARAHGRRAARAQPRRRDAARAGSAWISQSSPAPRPRAGRATAASRGQRVSAGGEPGGAACLSRVDADRILDALVENALNYSPDGAAVEIATLPRGLAVSDRGAGVTAGEQEQVFERFHRGAAGRRGVPGTGLGLPIARELARRWGGDVTLRPRDGRRLGGRGDAAAAVRPLPALHRTPPTLASCPRRRLFLLTLLAFAGLLVAVGITMAATELTSQSIGLQSEPIDAGDALAPAATAAAPRATRTASPSPKRTPTRTPTATPARTRTPAPTAAPPAPTAVPDDGDDNSGEGSDDDDGSGRGRGRGRGRGGDDDD